MGTSSFRFVPSEAPLPNTMTMTLIVPDEPTTQWGAVFTRNAFPGAPIKVGRALLEHEALGAVVINNKISNVCASGGGIGDSQAVCDAVAAALSLPRRLGGQILAPEEAAVLPCSTGVIGWKLPVAELIEAAPSAAAALQSESVLPAAEGILTTDLYPKVSSATIGSGGRIVGIAKGAGMIEPNMATMLAYILTDIDIPRDLLRSLLAEAVGASFNAISVDSDQSTSDTVAMLSSGRVPFGDAQGKPIPVSRHDLRCILLKMPARCRCHLGCIPLKDAGGLAVVGRVSWRRCARRWARCARSSRSWWCATARAATTSSASP